MRYDIGEQLAKESIEKQFNLPRLIPTSWAISIRFHFRFYSTTNTTATEGFLHW